MSLRSLLVVVVAAAAGVVMAGCGEDQCTPADFRGGYACGPEAGQYQSCQLVDCNGSCSSHWTIDVRYCPTAASNCKQLAHGQVVCLGDVLGTCLQPGFLRCEDVMTELACVSDGDGGLVLTRGACAAGARCYDPSAPSPGNVVGCDPDY